MTVIAGIVTDDGVVIAADRMLSSCYHKSDSGPKIFEREGWAYGNTGSIREIQIFESLTKDRRVKTRDDVLKLASDLHEEVKKLGPSKTDHDGTGSFNSEFLIATPEGLFCLAKDFGVTECRHFEASGIGYEYALGVIQDGYGKRDPVELIKAAIEAANALNPHCGGGPDIVRLAKRKEEVSVSKVETVLGDGARK